MKKLIILIILLLIVAAAVFAGFNKVNETVSVKFTVSGKVIDSKDKIPLYDVEVILLLDREKKEDQDRLMEEFRVSTSRWEGIPQKDWIGKTRKDGTYITETQKTYNRKYTTWYGIKPELKNPFKTAWIVLRKLRYRLKILQVSTTKWEISERGHINKLPQIELERK